MTTETLMRMMLEKEDLGGATNDRGYVNVVGDASLPGAATMEQGSFRSVAEAFLPDVLKERQIHRWVVDGGGGGGRAAGGGNGVGQTGADGQSRGDDRRPPVKGSNVEPFRPGLKCDA